MTPLLPTDYCIFTIQINVYYIKDLTFKLSLLGEMNAWIQWPSQVAVIQPCLHHHRSQMYMSLIIREFMENAL